MSENNLGALNKALFAQLDKLNNATGDQLKDEIERSRAASGIARDIISTATLALNAKKLEVEFSHTRVKLPPMLTEDGN